MKHNLHKSYILAALECQRNVFALSFFRPDVQNSDCPALLQFHACIANVARRVRSLSTQLIRLKTME
jgi:hypothetical protein